MVEPKKSGGVPYGPGVQTITNYEFGGEFGFEVEHRSEGSFYEGGDSYPEIWETRLPHSCDHWVIGNPSDLNDFIAEAQAVAEWLKART